ncbi:MAG: hypothetical protein ACXWWA_04980, partial [Chitinophagaceae bacterium]
IQFLSAILVTIFFVSCDKDDDDNNTPQPPAIKATVIKAAGDSAGIVAKLNEFRVLAGDPLNNAPGATNGRREVNWDGVPANFTNSNNFPFDFFGSADPASGNGRKRGLIMTNTGTSFRVDSTDFSEIDASYAAQFEAFSRKRLFTYMGNVVTEVTFKIPGTNTDASVKSFAVIFSDVDIANVSTVEYFNGTKSLGVFAATPAAQGFSLLGVGFHEEKITRVKITSGNGLLGAGVKDISDGGTKDLVVMDDFLYDEPKTNN